MPSADTEVKSSWADQVDDEGDSPLISKHGLGDSLPPSTETLVNGMKTVVEYKYDDEGRKTKVTTLYRIETRQVSKSIARRKAWKKFGASKGDKPGPNRATTVVAEDVMMQFITNKEESEKPQEDDALSKLRGAASKLVRCRLCKEEHWTTQCPYKDTLGPLQESLKNEEKKPAAGGAADDKNATVGGKYVPPSMREGGNRRGEAMANNRRADEGATIRVTNLSEDTRETDLQDLFRPFGGISRIFLAKDKITGTSKGFAFINFHKREDAARAIASVSGFGYDHLILNVEWAKPSTTT
jgi:translation initiation factor 3 subunit G